VLEDINRHALFNELHRSVEQSATVAVEQLMSGTPDLTYPPNHGFLADEVAALASIPKSQAMERALRKLIASAAATAIFDLLCLVDGVADAPELEDVRDSDSTAVDLMLHDGFYESYWAWRRRRPDPGWRLDTYEG
jgi:hypothetical protein